MTATAAKTTEKEAPFEPPHIDEPAPEPDPKDLPNTEDVPAKDEERSDADREMDRIDPIPDRVTLESGMVLLIEPLKTRQFFKLLRIVTRGGANVLPNFRISADMGSDEFAQNLIGLVIFAIPEAEQETIEFLRAMTRPEGLTGNRKADEALFERYLAELDNPELDDTISLVEAIVRREADDLLALGKRLMAMFRVAEKTGQTADLSRVSSEGSPQPST